MTDQSPDPRRRWPWWLSNAGILTTVVVVAAFGIAVLLVMLEIAADAPATERAKLRIEALKYGLGVFAAGGAVAALLLAVRRQLLAEHTHELSERNHQLALQAQAHTETDAAERRVTDLYTKAAEQLGHTDAAVRLAGLYALERVAQNNPRQRQTIVNVLCAYLRMPYTPPADATPAPTGPVSGLPLPRAVSATTRNPYQELQVRLTAQRILTSHLTVPPETTSEQAAALVPSADQPFWPDIDLDLTEAHLVDWSQRRSHVRRADFTRATFTGVTRFDRTTFTGDAGFARASFTGDAVFEKASFTRYAGFERATFSGTAGFSGATFTNGAGFERATFTGSVWFSSATFASGAEFGEAAFADRAGFGGVTFAGGAGFVGATFLRGARFEKAIFAGGAWFSSATFTGGARFGEATFTGAAGFSMASFTADARFSGASFTGYALFGEVTFTGNAGFEGVTFTGDATFTEATFTGDATFTEATFTAEQPTMVEGRVALGQERRDVWPPGWQVVVSSSDGSRWELRKPDTA